MCVCIFVPIGTKKKSEGNVYVCGWNGGVEIVYVQIKRDLFLPFGRNFIKILQLENNLDLVFSTVQFIVWQYCFIFFLILKIRIDENKHLYLVITTWHLFFNFAEINLLGLIYLIYILYVCYSQM